MKTRPILIISIFLTACTPHLISNRTSAPIPVTTFSPLATTTMQGDSPTMPSIHSTPTISDLQSLIEKAKTDLAQRLSISIDQINGIEAKAVVWSNSSLGCPQPGMVYAEVLTPGYLILVNANGQDYEYHAGKGADIFYCESPLPPIDGVLDNT